MTTDDTSGPDSGDAVPPSARPVAYYADPPTAEELAEERRGVEAQAAALSERRGMREAVEQVLERHRRPTEESGPGSRAIDTFTPEGGNPVLMVRGELLIRLEPRRLAQPGRAAEAAAAVDRGLTPSLAAELAELGYVAPQDQSRVGGVERFTSDRPGPQVWADVQRVLANYRVEASCHYMLPLGHVIKGDDFPVPAVTGRRPDPEWLERLDDAAEDHPWEPVAIIDTGITPELRQDGRLAAVPRPGAEDPLDVFPNGGDHRLDMGAGHGTFAAGAVDQVAPGCSITMYRAADSDGLCSDEDLARALHRAVDGGATIINVSMGMSTPNDVPPPYSQGAVAQILREHPDVLIVASAGNDGTTTPVFPAALPGVVAVGALLDDLRPADWSQRGFWVTCSTVGQGVASTFVEGVEPPVPGDYDGDGVQDADITFPLNSWGLWSGTSFAAPQICGAVAAWCRITGKRPRAALAELLTGQPYLPGFGSLIRLLPGTPTP